MSAASELAELIGADRVSTDPSDLAGHARDWSTTALLGEREGRLPPGPLCVVRPATTEHVRAILEWAHRSYTPVVPFGGGSGVCKAISADDAVVVDTSSMDRIVDFDEPSRLVTLQAGVTGPDAVSALADRGFTLGHEPQSLAISTVGGWVATRAAGQLSARYGGIEDLIAGLEAVLPAGRVVGWKPSPRRATGPDIASLMIGSEGTLGIVTEVTLRVSEIPTHRLNRCVRFEHMTDGVTACRLLAQSELRPTLVRLYDAEDSTIFLRHHPDEEPGPLLLLSFDGDGADDRADAALKLASGKAGNDALVDHWWAHRNDALEDFRRIMAGEGLLGPHGLVDTMEVSGTWSVLRELYHSMKKALSAEADLVGCHLSHVYPDGACLYYTLASALSEGADARATYDRWWEAGMRACLDAGGSISHHHGIGRLKARWLPEELNGWMPILVAVKRAIDPHGIMNPGALGL